MKRLLVFLIMLSCSVLSFAANEIKITYPSGNTVYVTIREDDGDVFYPTTNVFEVWGTSSRDAADYDIPMTDKSGNLYIGDFDADISAGRYWIQFWLQDGGAPDESVDADVGVQTIVWNGSAEEFVIDSSGRTDVGTIEGTDAADAINTEVDNVITSYNLHHLLQTTGVVVSSAGSAEFISDLASSTDNYYNQLGVIFTTGANVGQARRISDYTGSTKKVEVATIFTTTPSADDEFVIINIPFGIFVEELNPTVSDDLENLVWDSDLADHIANGTFGLQVAVTIPSLINNLNDFDPANDTVANVTLVDDTTDVTNQVTADVTAISGDSGAADNLEAMYDGTGYTDDQGPAKQIQLNQLAITGAAINQSAESRTLTTGSETGTFANTAALDQSYHQIDPSANTIQIYYEFNVGVDGIPTGSSFTGRLQDPPVTDDTITISAWNWGTSGWDQVGILVGANSSNDISDSYTLFTSHVGTGDDAGKVRLQFQDGSLGAATSLYIDQLFVSYAVVNRSVGYSNGAIWVDTINGTAGTTNFINGTADNPVDTWADALTLSGSLGIIRFGIGNGSSITLSGNSDNYSLIGMGWALDLNDQSIDGIHVMGAEVTGLGTNGGTSPTFHNCHIDDVSLPPSHLTDCGLKGNFTCTLAGDYFFDNCHSSVAGVETPTFDFGAGLNFSDVNFRRYSGGIEIENMGAGTGPYKMSLEGNGQLIINANCSAMSLVAIRGNFTVTDNASGVVSLSDDARYDVTQIDDTITANAVVTDIPNTSEFEARTLPSADYFDSDNDDVAVVTLVGTTTTNTDVRGTDNAALASTLNTKIPNNLNTTASGNIGIDWANVENPTTALDLSGTDIQLVDTVTTNTDMVGTDNAATSAKQDTMETTLNDVPSTAEFEARTLPAASYFDFSTDEVDMGGIKGTSLPAEVAAGSLANNFHQFFDINPVSSNDLDSLGTVANQVLLLEDLVDIKGTGFIKDTHSLIDIYTIDDFIRDVMEGDVFTNIAVTPWREEIRIKGTSTKLVERELFQVAGGNVTSTTHPIGRKEAP